MVRGVLVSHSGEKHMTAARDASVERASVAIRVGGVELAGELIMPADAPAIVIHAGPTEESRSFAERLVQDARFASLVVRLRDEPSEPLDVAMLAQRLAVVTDWVVMHDKLRWLPLAYAATGIDVAAALVTASARREVRAIVARAGRPDLAGAALENVRVPTLLVVDESDDALVALNRSARPRLRTSELAIVARAAMPARASDWLRHAIL
jgi:putative phosphoribosyl transferase